MPNWTYSVPISTGMFITLLSVHVNLISSGKVGLVLGGVVLAGEENIHTLNKDHLGVHTGS